MNVNTTSKDRTGSIRARTPDGDRAEQGTSTSSAELVGNGRVSHAGETSGGQRRRRCRPVSVWLMTDAPFRPQVEFFDALGRSDAVELEVRFMRATSRGRRLQDERPVGFAYRVMWGVLADRFSDAFRLHPRAIWEVATKRCDWFVLSGKYNSPTFLVCMLILWLRRRRRAIWCEPPWPEDYRPAWATRSSVRSPLVRWARRWILRALVRMATRVVCIGNNAVEGFERYGLNGSKAGVFPYVCELGSFERPDPAVVERVRREHQLQGKTVFLFSGKLIVRKGVDVLLEAFGRLAEQRPEVELVLLGEGPERKRLESSIGNDWAGRVHFVGHRPAEELPGWFGVADVFVFPSRYDGWATVINEACAARLPVITTEGVGAARLLVEHDRSGYVVARDDPCALHETMERLAADADRRLRFGTRSGALVAPYAPDRAVTRFLEALQGSVAPSPETNHD